MLHETVLPTTSGGSHLISRTVAGVSRGALGGWSSPWTNWRISGAPVYVNSPWLPGSHPVAPALTTPIRVGVAAVVTRPLPLSPLHTAPDGAEAHAVIALLNVSPPPKELHSP